MTALRAHTLTVWLLMRRGLNEVLRVPGAAIPGILAPTIFVLGFAVVFAELPALAGFETRDYLAFLVPVGLLQGAGFTGGATGVNLARDLEMGRFSRLLASPSPRWNLLVGIMLSASLRAALPAALLLAVALALGVVPASLPGLLLALAATALFAIVAALYGSVLALRLQTQSAAPLMQAGMFAAVLLTPALAPRRQLAPWMETIASANPVTYVLEMTRQGFETGGVDWSTTWPGLLALAGLSAVLATLVALVLRRTTAPQA